MKLSKLFEGWEELGIEDPNLEDQPDEAEKPNIGQIVFGKEVYPDYYIIRISEDTWKMLPIKDVYKDIGGALKSDHYHGLSMEQLLSLPRLQFEDLSLVYDPHEWIIEWIHGWELDEDRLLHLIPFNQ